MSNNWVAHQEHGSRSKVDPVDGPIFFLFFLHLFVRGSLVLLVILFLGFLVA
jgi:hypothetical protein